MVDDTPSHRSSSGYVAVESSERLICGAGAVRSAAAAEGLALAGSRAARVLAAEDVQPSAVLGAAAPWVLHRTTAASPTPFGAFELVAGTGQEAVDHCLVAHLSGLSGECLVGPEFAERLCVYQPLDSTAALTALAEVAGREVAAADPAALETELAAAFSRAARALGRPVEPVVSEMTSDADVVIIALGDERAAALELAESLREAKVACGVVGLTMLRPFPAKQLAPLLVGKRAILVSEAAWMRGQLSAGVEAAIGSSGGSKRPAVHAASVSAPDALVGFAKLLGVAAPAAPKVEGKSMVLAALPASSRADQLLADAAGHLAGLSPLDVWRVDVGARASALAVGKRRPARPGKAPIDVLFASHPALIDPLALVDALRDGATVVVPFAGKKPEQVWAELTPLQREVLTKKKVALMVHDPAISQAREVEQPSAPWSALVRAILGAAERSVVDKLGWDAKNAEALRAAQLVAIDPRSASAAALVPSPAKPVETPRLPKPSTEPSLAWRDALRRFHVSGQGASGASALLPLAPAAVSSLIAKRGTSTGFPLLIDEASERPVVPLELALAEALEAAKLGGASVSVIEDHLPRLVAAASQLLAEERAAQSALKVLPRALEKFAAEFQISDIARKSLDEELAALGPHLPRKGRVLGLGEHAHLELYAALVLAERRQRTSEFVAQVRLLADKLSEVLRLDATRSASNAPALGLGEGASDMFDASALVQNVPKQRGPRALSAERRARIERLVAVLKGYVATAASETELFVIHAGTVPDGIELGRARLVQHEDGFGVAAGMFDGVSRRMAEVFAAARAAKNEIAERSEDASAEAPELVWEGFTRDELMLVPPIVVLERADRVWQTSLDSLSRLLRSGRPVHVIIEELPTVGGTPPGLGYVLVAHHEAFVVQSTLARAEHLAESLGHMSKALRPAALVVMPRPAPGPMPSWLELAGAHEGRAVPCFRYEPDRGTSWADCFDIRGNPDPEQLWPRHTLDVVTADGAAEQLSLAFTFADAVALGLAFREHFWLIPPEAWSDEQVELEKYIASLAQDLPQQIPFIWVVADDGTLARAVLTRQLAFECRERQRVWHMVQELGGADNEHARRAAVAARQSAMTDADAAREALEAAHAAELERVRKEEAAEALGRLAKALLDPDALLAAPSGAAPQARQAAPPPAAPVEAAPAAAEAAPPPAPVEEEESVSFSDPFIDTPLCTTCNECTNLNPLMFKYNADKQAYLADAKAGTFLQLVTAAEKCPAACIHPGAPRKDDSTVTDDLVARAARFN